MATWFAVLLLGLACAGGGGQLFVRGTVGLAMAARVSPGIIAATVAAFATSSPELTIAVTSAIEGSPEISFGNVLGGNLVNISVILGTALLLAPMHVPQHALRRDYPVAALLPVLIAVLLSDGTLSRLDGLLLLAGFATWMTAIVHAARSQRSSAPALIGERRLGPAVVESVAGLGLLMGAGHLIVTGATNIAAAYGVSEFIIGTTIVAIGTTVPELATVIVARLKRHDEVGLGTLLGSNIFNGLFIIGVAASITPIHVSFADAAPVLVLGLAAMLMTYPRRSGELDRWRGGLLLAIYVVYVASLLHNG
jgi:cation:H+ antiporter